MIHPEPSSAKLNELLEHASFKYIFVVMTKARFCELNLSLERRELIMIFIFLFFFVITQARSIKSSKITSGYYAQCCLHH